MDITTDLYTGINHCLRCGHALIIKHDRENKLRPQCPACGWIYYKNPIPAAACVVFNKNNELLLIKRKMEPKAGEWALPSGYIEINQTPAETAVAELAEETGLHGEITKFIDYFVGYSPIYTRILSFGFLLKVVGGSLQAGDDALEAEFFPLDKLKPIAFAAHRHYVQKVLRKS